MRGEVKVTDFCYLSLGLADPMAGPFEGSRHDLAWSQREGWAARMCAEVQAVSVSGVVQ